VLFRDRHLPQSLLGTAFFISVGAEMATLYFFARIRARFTLAPILAVTFADGKVLGTPEGRPANAPNN
jgi:hypothetical protein